MASNRPCSSGPGQLALPSLQPGPAGTGAVSMEPPWSGQAGMGPAEVGPAGMIPIGAEGNTTVGGAPLLVWANPKVGSARNKGRAAAAAFQGFNFWTRVSNIMGSLLEPPEL